MSVFNFDTLHTDEFQRLNLRSGPIANVGPSLENQWGGRTWFLLHDVVWCRETGMHVTWDAINNHLDFRWRRLLAGVVYRCHADLATPNEAQNWR